MADNSQRFLVICNQVNLNVVSQTHTKSPGLWSLKIIKSPIQFVYAGVFETFSFWMHSIVHFSHFVSSVENTIIFVATFWL